MKDLLRIELERLHDGPMRLERVFTAADLDLTQDPEFRFPGPISLELVATIATTGDSILLRGSITTTAQAACVRCLEDLPLDVCARFEIGYLRRPDGWDGRAHRDDDALYFDGDYLEPLEQLREELMVALPYLPSCTLQDGDFCPVRGIVVGPMVFGPRDESAGAPAPAPPAIQPKSPNKRAGNWKDQLADVREHLDPEDRA